ncbi:MAG: hypothetical protein JOY71_03270 [Acetobacteraceae bacterium]|nr:hypothetical protein [Acetobacteraceae bacterium]MBV8521146.1 hypothetical protein [Acetobacteraceae bacterium]
MSSTRTRIGLPDAHLILGETVFTPKTAVLLRRTAQYRIITTSEVDAYEHPLSAAEAEVFGFNRVRSVGDKFQGSAREAAKLSIPDAVVKEFGSVAEVLDSLPAEDPDVSDRPDSGRTPEEECNVRVRAFLYAASRESDNDFHLIVGDQGDAARMMTMEVSGLPSANAASFAQLKSARDAYKRFFADQLPGFGYDHYDPPIPVEIQGALFYDATHAGSRRGRQTCGRTCRGFGRSIRSPRSRSNRSDGIIMADDLSKRSEPAAGRASGARRPTLPDEQSVVAEKRLVSPKGRRYRILRTDERDAYEQSGRPDGEKGRQKDGRNSD